MRRPELFQGAMLAAMQAELSRMNEENQRLRGMLTQVTNSYQALQMHLVALMQQRNQLQLPPAQPQQPPHHEDGGKTEQGAMVPRQFLGLGPSGAGGADVVEEPSNSSPEVGSPRRSSSISSIAGARPGEPFGHQSDWRREVKMNAKTLGEGSSAEEGGQRPRPGQQDSHRAAFLSPP